MPLTTRNMILLLSTTMLALAAQAQSHHAGHGTASAAPATMAAGPATQAYNESMNRMHADMMAGIGHADPDTAFAAGMLAHHEGAVEMAKIQLQYGKDAQMRKLAQDVIDAQEAEIALMRQWLQTHAPEALPKPNNAARPSTSTSTAHH